MTATNMCSNFGGFRCRPLCMCVGIVKCYISLKVVHVCWDSEVLYLT